MSRTFHPIDLVALPKVSARELVSLVQSLITHATSKEKANAKVVKAIKAEKDIHALLARLENGRDATQAALSASGQATAPPVVAAADRREDAAVAALYVSLDGWARLDGEIPLGTLAAALQRALFGQAKLSITKLPTKEEWAAVEGGIIAQVAEHRADLTSLGLTPVVEHLRAVHAEYGRATGMTEVKAEPDSPAVLTTANALREVVRDYVLQVTAAVRRHTKPLAADVGEALLQPLTSHDTTEAPAKTPATPPATPAPTTT